MMIIFCFYAFMISKVFFDAERFKDIEIDPVEKLPNKAVPFVWYFVKKLWVPLCVILVSYIIAIVLIALEPVFFGQMVGAITTGDRETLWQSLGLLVLLYIVLVQGISRLGWQIGHAVESYVRPVMTMLVRRQLSVYLHQHSYKFFQDDYAGRLAGKVVEMPQDIVDTIDDALNPILYTTIMGLVSICVFSLMHWLFAVSVIVFFALTLLLMRWRVPIIYKNSELFAENLNYMRGRFIDSVSNILLVKLFSRQKYEDDYFTASLIKAGKSEQLKQWQFVLLWRGQHILNALFQSAIVLIAIEGYRVGHLGISDVATALPLSAVIAANSWWLLLTLTHFFSRFANIQEALDTIIQEHEVLDAPDAKTLEVQSPNIEINKITFSYPNRPVFNAFSLNVPANQRIGLVGPSGAGKSTLIQLILRLFDLENGQITIGDHDISKVTQESLRDTISVIPQMTDLMHRSIFENIIYGKPNASHEEVVEAAKKAHIHDVIVTLTDKFGNKGYDAIVGERGVKLSGGQRQRIAIARAFLKDAPILLLDEATSALDSESERLIQSSLINLMEGRTVIVIAHRLSTISHLNRIVVMQDGEIVEDGTHQKLLKQKGLYSRLWGLQSEGFLGKNEEQEA